jgi:hypothetical protein
MRVMVIVKSDDKSESGALPSLELLRAMGAFNDQLIKAGLLLDAGGLKPSKFGKRVKFSKGERNVVDGPFAEAKELVGGFWIWEVKSMDEAMEWVHKIPSTPKAEFNVEVRPLSGPEDFGEQNVDEVRAREKRQRAELEANKAK